VHFSHVYTTCVSCRKILTKPIDLRPLKERVIDIPTSKSIRSKRTARLPRKVECTTPIIRNNKWVRFSLVRGGLRSRKFGVARPGNNRAGRVYICRGLAPYLQSVTTAGRASHFAAKGLCFRRLSARRPKYIRLREGEKEITWAARVRTVAWWRRGRGVATAQGRTLSHTPAGPRKGLTSAEAAARCCVLLFLAEYDALDSGRASAGPAPDRGPACPGICPVCPPCGQLFASRGLVTKDFHL